MTTSRQLPVTDELSSTTKKKERLIGYWLPERKKQKLDLDKTSQILRRSGVEFREIDLERPLSEQGCFDVILHKIDFFVAAESGDTSCQIMLKNFMDYCETHKVEVVDPLIYPGILDDRLAMCQVMADICKGLKGVFTPPFVLLEDVDPEVKKRLVKEAGITYPCVLKPQDARLHEMAVVFNENDLDEFETPCVATSFINHDAILNKIFIIADEFKVVKRPSIRNLFPGDFAMERFHSARISKPDADHPLTVPSPCSFQCPPSPTCEVDNKMAATISKRFRERVDQRLLGVDVVVESSTGRYGIIDANGFPGYEGVEKFAEFMGKCLLQVLNERDRDKNGDLEDSGVEMAYLLESGRRKQ